ncbi:MAG: hypothetical protein CMJ74_02055 [Planctomycetaceae bacterium]|nr:hypothetical protein [Planctomycetaceae bacterium]|tara:strand:- start:1137 stop:2468 length:1332 start_codon:yes stop_codon:yes gene_type:complete
MHRYDPQARISIALKITIVNQFYPPDISPTARLAASLAEHRAALDDRVTVIGGQGYLGSGQSHARICPKQNVDEQKVSWRSETESDSNIHVHRLWTPKSGKRTLVHRCLDYFAFYFLACLTIARLPKQDVVVCMTTPPLIAGAGILHKLIHRTTRVILWNMDCYPEVAERSGIIRSGGLIDRLWKWMNLVIGSQLDHVVCLDDAMQQIINARPRADQIPKSVIPNWEPLAEFPLREVKHIEKQVQPPFTILYSGNMGHGHCFTAMLSAARLLLEKESSIRFVMTGGGIQSSKIQQRIKDERLTNITFMGYVSTRELRDIQSQSHCALITLKDSMLGCMSPSKLHASLAMGLPIVYLGPAGSSVDETISHFGCGVSLRNGDVNGFVSAMETLAKSPHLQQRYSDAARRSFESNYCDQKNLKSFDAVINATAVISDRLEISRDAA